MTDVVEVARELIRMNTTNLPGAETQAARYVGDLLTDAGVEWTLVAKDVARANIVARMPGRGEGPSLAFVGHLDVVPADARDWEHPPFAARIDDAGYLHGRGAVDMKNEVAARVVAMMNLARSGFRPAGDLLLILTADEEDGTAQVGMNWLVEAMPEIRTDYAVNEGGGRRIALGDGRYANSVGIGEKGTLPLRITARGESGHASMPSVGDNAIPHLATLLTRLGQGGPEVHTIPEVSRPFFAALLGEEPDGDAAEVLRRVVALNPSLRHIAPALAGTTMAPTMLQAGLRLNILPARASVDLDCRVLPGVSRGDVIAEVRRRLGDDIAYDLEPIDEYIAGNSSSPDGPLMDATRAWIAQQDPESIVVPTISTGFTDSVYLRRVLGVQALAYCPAIVTPGDVVEAGFHNRNERIHVDDLALGVAYHEHIARAVLA
jgi:acetylornithine deacetylase/succinyl-diaminopimelate desuccinylase-like protein